ncbi:MAG: hypothetical protein EZS28_025410 [Streblomastix strix]|uniref:Uncharacterized protein n=1 Tax=Streblomastix strix TaxID=222440 RepID=A0A5J4V9E4_9EUKA|nr:MAG: hypothetical protein EZS28_025410 [Streblomastix strix]
MSHTNSHMQTPFQSHSQSPFILQEGEESVNVDYNNDDNNELNQSQLFAANFNKNPNQQEKRNIFSSVPIQQTKNTSATTSGRGIRTNQSNEQKAWIPSGVNIQAGIGTKVQNKPRNDASTNIGTGRGTIIRNAPKQDAASDAGTAPVQKNVVGVASNTVKGGLASKGGLFNSLSPAPSVGRGKARGRGRGGNRQ